MYEWNDKYRNVERFQTNSKIDKDMILFLGLTIFDFVLGVLSFLGIIMFWDSKLSIFAAIISAFVSSFLSRSYREKFPPLFLIHFNWSLGIQKNKIFPNFFKKRRFKVYGP